MSRDLKCILHYHVVKCFWCVVFRLGWFMFEDLFLYANNEFQVIHFIDSIVFNEYLLLLLLLLHVIVSIESHYSHQRIL